MWKIRANRRFLTNLLFISAILFKVQLVNTDIMNENHSFETSLPDLIPNEDAIIKSNQTTVIVSSSSSTEEDEIHSTLVNTLQSTNQIQEEDQAHLTNNQVVTTEETADTIEFNIKHEISNTSFFPAIESRIISTTTESSIPQLFSIANTRLVELDMSELPIKVQKCCPSGQIMVLGQPGEQSICQVSNEDFDIPVFHSNSTHYWNYTSTASSDVEIVARDPCKQRKFFLDPDDPDDIFRILSNSSLYIPFSMEMLNNDKYCVDTIQGSDKFFTTAIICTSPPKINIFHYFYIAGLIISVVALILLATYTMRRKDIKNEHKKCLAFFAGTMATAYIFITVHTEFRNYFNYNINLIIAYLIYYLNLNYYLWLNMLSIDTYRCVRDADIETKSFMKWYTTAAFSIPLIFVLLSFIDGFNPPLPNLYLEQKFPSSYTAIIVLYILPVFVSIVGNIILIGRLSLPKARYNNVKDLITSFQSKDWKAPPRNIREIRKMYRRTLALFLIILASFILDVVISFLPSTGEQQAQFISRDTIFCLLGLFISVTFFKVDWFCSKCCKKTAANTSIEAELMPMTNGIV